MATRGYIRYPAISGDRVVFTAEDDLWLVPTSGGRAERLTAGVAEMTHARFSPDGASLAYTARDEGPAEVHILPLSPRRYAWLTHGRTRRPSLRSAHIEGSHADSAL